MLYCINRIKKETVAGQRTAGKKAPDDMASIIENRCGGTIFPFYEIRFGLKGVLNLAEKFLVNCSNWRRLFKTVKKGDIVVIQHPYEGIKQSAKNIVRCSRKGVHTILLIHDISVQRKDIDIQESNVMNRINERSELSSLKSCEYIICHNSFMKEYLVELGVEEEKISCLGIFDYLTELKEQQERKLAPEIAIAGNLARNKSGYIYRIPKDTPDIKYLLYGPNYDGEKEGIFEYKGIFPPELLPEKLEGSFGLVWDGEETEGCGGVAGEYIKINNPHKCSLYLASGLPVAIWDQAALASYVRDNQVGICVSSLSDIPEAVKKLTDDEYFKMLENVDRVGKAIRAGDHIFNAMNSILEKIEKQ